MIIREWEDKPHYKGAREQLSKEIEDLGITNQNVLEAIKTLPRHFFVNISYVDRSYDNRPLPIKKEQTISQPYTVAFQTELLMPVKGEKIMEIGTGSGYQAAILAFLGAEVHTIERHKELFEEASELLKHEKLLQYFHHTPHIYCYYGDGYEGLPEKAPFDRIIITAAIKEIPQTLFNQLKEDGILVAPVGDDYQEMTRFTKKKNNLQKETFGKFSFVPMLKGKE
jgi:protein-L-isoaspartate(D-aspartate) O-methyltransferase